MTFHLPGKRNYKPKACQCWKCTAPGAVPVIYIPSTGPQRVANECLDVQLKRKQAVNRAWAKKKREQQALAQGPRGPNRVSAASLRTPIIRCDTCADCSWRRPLDGCHTCGRPYYEEVIERTN